jgi:threonine/homoserine/homoserine lactone efflux protein
LVVALLFLVTAVRELFGGDDPNAPPPKWMSLLTSATPTKAFLIGTGIMTVSPKSWVFTLAAIGAIGNAGMGRAANVVCYIVFVTLAASGNLLIIGMAAFFPQRSRSVLDRTLRWLQEHDRPIMIVVGLVFGTWFGIKALHGFGIL